jgi:hypothetical protein
MTDTIATRDRFVPHALHPAKPARHSLAAAEARSAGYGGIATVARALSIIGRGLADLAGVADRLEVDVVKTAR